MHPILFEIWGFPVYTYGVLLAAAYLLGLQFALMRARARGLDPQPGHGPRNLDHRQRAARPRSCCCCCRVRIPTSAKSRELSLSLVRSEAVFYCG
jgi:hypothetical protein